MFRRNPCDKRVDQIKTSEVIYAVAEVSMVVLDLETVQFILELAIIAL